MPEPMTISVPGCEPMALTHLVIDFTGTLSRDGRLLPGVTDRLRGLAAKLHILVATADTFGKARQSLVGLPLEVRLVKTGRDKARIVSALGPEHVVAIGNGRNDLEMFEIAALAIAVIGQEGVATELIGQADIVVRDIRNGLDLLAHPLRIVATLRN